MTDEDRERGAVDATLRRLDVEVDKLRTKSHTNSSLLQSHENWIEVLKGQKADDRLKALEGWRQWVLGAAAAVGAIAGVLGSWAGKHLP